MLAWPNPFIPTVGQSLNRSRGAEAGDLLFCRYGGGGCSPRQFPPCPANRWGSMLPCIRTGTLLSAGPFPESPPPFRGRGVFDSGPNQRRSTSLAPCRRGWLRKRRGSTKVCPAECGACGRPSRREFPTGRGPGGCCYYRSLRTRAPIDRIDSATLRSMRCR